MNDRRDSINKRIKVTFLSMEKGNRVFLEMEKVRLSIISIQTKIVIIIVRNFILRCIEYLYTRNCKIIYTRNFVFSINLLGSNIFRT